MTSLPHVARPASAGWAPTLSHLMGRVSAWNDARVTRHMLRRLSREQLDDIGLAPADIDAIATARR